MSVVVSGVRYSRGLGVRRVESAGVEQNGHEGARQMRAGPESQTGLRATPVRWRRARSQSDLFGSDHRSYRFALGGVEPPGAFASVAKGTPPREPLRIGTSGNRGFPGKLQVQPRWHLK